MILRTISCEKKGCNNIYTEAFENEGFPKWGHVAGVNAQDENKKFITITLCPDHLNEVIKWLTGQI